MQSNTIPAWFNGTIYTEGAIVENPFSKEEYELNEIELSIYDFIMGTTYLMEIAPKAVTPQSVKLLRKGLDWFRKNNAEAYMALLD
jgi:hypothetical protein